MAEQPRAARLVQIQRLLESRAAGFTTAELARHTGVDIRTIQRDIATLQNTLYFPLVKEGSRYRHPRDGRLSLDINLHEARALLFAARLFVRHSEESDPYAAAAIEKLAQAMPASVRDQVRAAAASVRRSPHNAEFTRILTTVTEAWVRHRVLRISYRSAGKHRPHDVTLHPYFIEPSGMGSATYVIGLSETHGAMRTFKAERIVSAALLPRQFEIPPDLNLDDLLRSAWGIIWGEGVLVRLRFSAAVTWRVKESRWHPSQQVDDLPDGGCILTMNVASLMELGRWVRSWGHEVEVLVPDELRQQLREEALRTARMYSGKPRPQPRTRRDRRAGEDGGQAGQRLALP